MNEKFSKQNFVQTKFWDFGKVKEWSVTKLLKETGMCSSISDAKRCIQQDGVSLGIPSWNIVDKKNHRYPKKEDMIKLQEDIIFGEPMMITKGKKTVIVTTPEFANV